MVEIQQKSFKPNFALPAVQLSPKIYTYNVVCGLGHFTMYNKEKCEHMFSEIKLTNRIHETFSLKISSSTVC